MYIPKKKMDTQLLNWFCKKIKNSKLTNQMKGFFLQKNTEPKKIIKEYRVEKQMNIKQERNWFRNYERCKIY